MLVRITGGCMNHPASGAVSKKCASQTESPPIAKHQEPKADKRGTTTRRREHLRQEDGHNAFGDRHGGEEHQRDTADGEDLF